MCPQRAGSPHAALGVHMPMVAVLMMAMENDDAIEHKIEREAERDERRPYHRIERAADEVE